MDFIDELKNLKEQIKFNQKFNITSEYDNIVISGMGGSGIVGDIFQEKFSKNLL